MPLPSLPIHSEAWPPALHHAHRILSDIHQNVSNAIGRSNLNSHRVQHHLTTLTETAIPMLLVISEADDIPDDWLYSYTEAFSTLVSELLCLQHELSNQQKDSSHLHFVKPVRVVKTGGRGRPRKEVDAAFLKEALDPRRNISVTKLASKLGMHRKTLARKMKEANVHRQFARLTNRQLDKIVQVFKKSNPDSGLRYLTGFLRTQGFRVQRWRVYASIKRVDRLGRMIRARFKKVKAQRPNKYKTSRPNALWHNDGHHKLGMYGIVIHGAVDGFSRTVVGLQASDNNRASTVLKMFVKAIDKYGVPSRVRGDRGGENRDVAILMVLLRGANRASFMWGSSTFNTRIERLWVEVGTQFARSWRAFFTRLEKEHLLERSDPGHLWLLHYLFLAEINEDCARFQSNWNSHPISGEGHNQSPNDLRFLGQLEHGIYRDDLDECEGMSIEEITARYGIDREMEPAGPSEIDQDGEGEDDPIGRALKTQGMQINHEPVEIASSRQPFSSAQLRLFKSLLKALQDEGTIPAGYGVRQEELAGGVYTPYEHIRAGIKGGGKELRISLPYETWHNRYVKWAQGLYAMNAVLLNIDTDE